jgi:Domain of unknown function (DUF4419)
MSLLRPFFKYRVVTRCGIPEVTLLGTPEDWESIRVRARALGEFDLEWWSRALEPVLARFAAASRGSIDGAFWRSFYEQDEGSGGPWVSGWLNAFFPFLVPSREKPVRNRLATDWDDAKNRDDDPTLSDFPCGLAAVEFVWEYLRTELPMELLGGFVGVSQDPVSLAVRPATGWVVLDGKLPPPMFG